MAQQYREIYAKHKFLVEAGWESAAFQKCSELSVEAAKIEYYEGGTVIPIKDAGRLTYSDVTLDRGVSSNLDMHNWMNEINDAAQHVDGGGPESFGLGALRSAMRRQVDITQLDRDNDVVRRHTLYNAFPTKYVAGDWDNTVDEVVIEQLTLTYDYFDPTAP